MAHMQLQSLAMSFLATITLIVVQGEVISDLSVDASMDEKRALEVKAEQFWGSILAAAQNAKMGEHAQLYQDTDKVMKELSPPHYEYVRQALKEALSHLRHADDLIL